MFRCLTFTLLTSLTLTSQGQTKPPAACGPVPTAAQIRWHETEMNAFIHFGLNTYTDKEWGYGDEDPKLFNPAKFDSYWFVEYLWATGFKTIILTAKHHDGFCLWPSKFSEHTIANSPYQDGKGDFIKVIADICHARKINFGIYLSPWDRNRSDYGQPSYVDYYRNQLNEIVENYSPISEIWLDGANGGDGFYGGAKEKRIIDGSTYYQWPQTIDMVKKKDPNVIFFSDAGPGARWVGNERGEAGETNWNTITPDSLYAGKPGIENLLQTGSPDGTKWIPSESDVSIRPGWFYHESENDKVKSAEELFKIYMNTVGRGSTLLLNVAPDRNGNIPEKDTQILLEWRKLLDNAFHLDITPSLGTVKTSSTRGKDQRFSASKLTDRNSDTYWATDDHVKTGTIEVTFRGSEEINYVVIQEYIKLGQRIKGFKVSAKVDGQWKEVYKGTTIGYKRIIPVESILAEALKIEITDSKACLAISNLQIY